MDEIMQLSEEIGREQGSRGAGEQRRKRENSPLPHRSSAPRPIQQNLVDEQAGHLEDDWQDILWREWRNTDDEEYAGQLFELIGDTPVSRVAIVFNLISGMFSGGLVGLLIALEFLDASTKYLLPTIVALLGVGAIAGGVLNFGTQLVEPKMTWRKWLARVTFNLGPHEMGLILVALGILLIGSQIAWVMSISIGLGGSIGILALIIVLSMVLGAKLIGWLIGLKRRPNPNYLHRFRKLWIWWRNRPHGYQVESALRQACAASPETQAEWSSILQQLTQNAQRVDSLQQAVDQLQSRNWTERFLARQKLTKSGGDGVKLLHPLATKITSPLRRTAFRLLLGIGQETTVRLAYRANQLLCPTCLAFFGRRKLFINSTYHLVYYGCRLCGQSNEFWEGQVIALLDSPVSDTPSHHNGTTRINWLARRNLFDFHTVEISRASDEDVERFAVQIGNDTDPLRKSLYKKMRCTVNSASDLSENTLRILESIFGEVEVI